MLLPRTFFAEQMAREQQVEEATYDTENDVPKSPLSECMVAISVPKRFPVLYGLLTRPMEKSLATLRKNTLHEMSTGQRQLTLHDISHGLNLGGLKCVQHV